MWKGLIINACLLHDSYITIYGCDILLFQLKVELVSFIEVSLEFEDSIHVFLSMYLLP